MKKTFGKIEKNCGVCKKNFLVHRYRENSAFFCSKKCMNKGMSEKAKELGFGKWMKGRKGNAGSYKKGQASPRGMLGKTAWNKGIHHIAISGENSHLWRGGITPINKALRSSLEYEEWRTKVFERD